MREDGTRLGGRALSGRLEVRAEARTDGRTVLVDQYHSVPFHLSKPYWDGRVLLLQVANPTAGLFSGDVMRCKICVGAGAALLLTSQGANRVHPRRAGDPASRFEQRFEVEDGGWLEVLPELLIPQKGSELVQDSVVEVEEGGRLYYAEMLAPGRTARGERYAYLGLEWRFRLEVGGVPVAVERAVIDAETVGFMFAVRGWEQAYFGCVWVVAPEAEEVDAGRVEAAVGDGDVMVGVTRLAVGVVAVKVLARGSIGLRRALGVVRGVFAERVVNLNASARKL
ncbi:MAG: urease accessory protein UreD [Verrucomicrobiales bacterium]|nr:urease accessory protein UreD [Verrucomicrobiales bacterium]